MIVSQCVKLRTLKVSSSASQKPSRAMMKLALLRTATGKEDPELPLLQRISSLELTTSDCSSNKCFSSWNRHISTLTVQRRPWIRPSWLNCCKETTTQGHQYEEETYLGQETQAMDNRLVEICPLVWWVQMWVFWSQLPCLCETHSWWTDDLACVVPAVKHGGGGVMVWGCFAGDIVCDLFRI